MSVVLVVHLLQDGRHAGQIVSLQQNMGQDVLLDTCTDGVAVSVLTMRGEELSMAMTVRFTRRRSRSIISCTWPLMGPCKRRSSGSPQTQQNLAATSTICCASHHVPAVQDVQDGAEQLDAGLVVGFDGAVVQLAAQLVGDQRQQNVPAVCGAQRPSQRIAATTPNASDQLNVVEASHLAA